MVVILGPLTDQEGSVDANSRTKRRIKQYYQEADKDKTTFTTRQGLYRFVRMPYGLMNAPGTFQRMTNLVMRGLNWLSCLVYLDDIIVFTKGSIAQHVVEVAMVLERLRLAGLSLNLKKCEFAAKTIQYLGHDLRPEGIRPMTSLVQAVADFPVPIDAVEVKRFVHMADYYRRFVPGFGSLMAPMTKLLRAKATWVCEEQQEAFDKVKTMLIKRPILIYPDSRAHFILETDASAVGFGACLIKKKCTITGLDYNLWPTLAKLTTLW